MVGGKGEVGNDGVQRQYTCAGDKKIGKGSSQIPIIEDELYGRYAEKIIF